MGDGKLALKDLIDAASRLPIDLETLRTPHASKQLSPPPSTSTPRHIDIENDPTRHRHATLSPAVARQRVGSSPGAIPAVHSDWSSLPPRQMHSPSQPSSLPSPSPKRPDPPYSSGLFNQSHHIADKWATHEKDLGQQLQHLKQINHELLEALTSIRSTFDSGRSRALEEAVITHSKLEERIHTKTREIDEVNAVIEARKIETDELCAQINVLKEEHERCKMEMAALEKECQGCRESIIGVQSSIDKTTKDLKLLPQAAEENDRSRSRRQQLASQVEEWEHKLAALRSSIGHSPELLEPFKQLRKLQLSVEEAVPRKQYERLHRITEGYRMLLNCVVVVKKHDERGRASPRISDSPFPNPTTQPPRAKSTSPSGPTATHLLEATAPSVPMPHYSSGHLSPVRQQPPPLLQPPPVPVLPSTPDHRPSSPVSTPHVFTHVPNPTTADAAPAAPPDGPHEVLPFGLAHELAMVQFEDLTVSFGTGVPKSMYCLRLQRDHSLLLFCKHSSSTPYVQLSVRDVNSIELGPMNRITVFHKSGTVRIACETDPHAHGILGFLLVFGYHPPPHARPFPFLKDGIPEGGVGRCTILQFEGLVVWHHTHKQSVPNSKVRLEPNFFLVYSNAEHMIRWGSIQAITTPRPNTLRISYTNGAAEIGCESRLLCTAIAATIRMYKPRLGRLLHLT